MGIPPAPRGTPQIEVTFDVDANGILNVNAVDKASGKSEKIRIERNGQLNQAEIAPALQKISEAIAWLDSNQLATKEEFEHYQKELESTIGPLMAKLYGGGGAPSA